jgi:hypothetical protein
LLPLTASAKSTGGKSSNGSLSNIGQPVAYRQDKEPNPLVDEVAERKIKLINSEAVNVELVKFSQRAMIFVQPVGPLSLSDALGRLSLPTA